MLHKGGGAIPTMPGFTVAWSYRGDGTIIGICYRAVPLITCGMAWGPHEASSLWGFLGSLAKPLAMGSNTPSTVAMPRLPWMAVVLLPLFALVPFADGRRLGSFERCLGLALLRHRLQRN